MKLRTMALIHSGAGDMVFVHGIDRARSGPLR